MNLRYLDAGERLDRPDLFMRGTKFAGIIPRVAKNWFIPAGPQIGALFFFDISMASPR